MSVEVSFFDIKVKPNSPVYLVECDSPEQNKIFRNTIDNFHSYVKYTDSPTRNLRWLVYETESGNQIGAIGLSSATIAVSIRDKFIGWDNKTKIKNLCNLANNSRFCLAQPRISIKNAASSTLKQLRIEGAKRWKEKYGDELILLETFVQPERDEEYQGNKTRRGSCYRADNWMELGLTSGSSFKKCPLLLWQKETGERGRIARENPKLAMETYGNYGGKQYIVTQSKQKLMFIKPLVKNWKKRLTQ
jgi:hypothetical protein